jgi:hypothetical protein
MKIGILIRDFKSLEIYELRIIQGIINTPGLELSLLIKDGRKEFNSRKANIKRNLLTFNIFANVLFKLQYVFESKIYAKKQDYDRTAIIEVLDKTESVSLHPRRKGFLDIFSKEESEIVKNYGLDIILRHEFNIIRGDILNSARYGIWSFHHGDNAVNRGGPAGFWEIVQNEAAVGVTLQKLTPELDGGLVIDKGYINWHWSFYRTSKLILEESPSILFRNIKLLQQGKLKPEKSMVYYNRLYKKPGLFYVLKYMIKFYSNFFRDIIDKLLFKIFRKHTDCWTIFLSKGQFLESVLFRIDPVPLKKNEIWADPFLFYHQDQLYVFFENYQPAKKRGKISCAKVVEGKLEDITDVMDLNVHLSYPFIIREGNSIFMIPETSENNRLEVYKCVQFPQKWELYSVGFEGESIVDTTYFEDESGDRWLFLNKGFSKKCELHIYRIDSLKLEKIESHALNPVSINSLNSRNGGAFFKYANDYYRPSQMSAHGVYGQGLNLNKILTLSLDEYAEETVVTVKPDFKKGLKGIHHLHQSDDYFVFDACYKRK